MVISLGNGDHESDSAIQLAAQLSKNVEGGYDMPLWFAGLAFDVGEGRRIGEQKSYIALLRFLTRPYWSRL
jgi:hypothetical protein